MCFISYVKSVQRLRRQNNTHLLYIGFFCMIGHKVTFLKKLRAERAWGGPLYNTLYWPNEHKETSKGSQEVRLMSGSCCRIRHTQKPPRRVCSTQSKISMRREALPKWSMGIRSTESRLPEQWGTSAVVWGHCQEQWRRTTYFVTSISIENEW